MNKNLNDYVKIYSMLNQDEQNKVLSTIKNNNWQPHFYRNTVTREKHVNETQAFSSVCDNSDVDAFVSQKIRDSFYSYLVDINFEFFGQLAGHSRVQYHKTLPGTEWEKHADHIHTLFDGKDKGIPVLSAVGLLNDDFEGGEFIMFDDDVIPMKAGDIIIFPSCFLFPHKVNLVKTGNRHSYVSWAW
jgi:predicted 2-oxoglutarate/Fe(II)-dependent dioxygenase YbiX